MIVYRKEGFYFIENAPQGVPEKKWAEDNALRNPGTIKIENDNKEIVWSLQ